MCVTLHHFNWVCTEMIKMGSSQIVFYCVISTALNTSIVLLPLLWPCHKNDGIMCLWWKMGQSYNNTAFLVISTAICHFAILVHTVPPFICDIEICTKYYLLNSVNCRYIVVKSCVLLLKLTFCFYWFVYLFFSW